MKETRTEEINLQDTEGDSGWLVRCNPEMVEVTHLKLQGNTLLYKGRTEDAADEKWLPMDEGSSVVAATIDSLYEAVWQRIGKVALW